MTPCQLLAANKILLWFALMVQFIVHLKCKIGDTVLLKVGGSCVWSPENSSLQKNTLLIAGGIGINPILSILLNIEETRAATTTNFGRSVLLYSASANEELIFKVGSFCKWD